MTRVGNQVDIQGIIIYRHHMRTIIDLPEDQLRGLAEFCRREHISRAEAIRRAVGQLVEEEGRQDLKSIFGSWKKVHGRAEAHLKKIRSEWE